MTFDIDEATDFCKHKASNYKRMSVDAGTMDLNTERARFEEECKRYEQLAEWLTELKARREAQEHDFCKECVYENTQVCKKCNILKPNMFEPKENDK